MEATLNENNQEKPEVQTTFGYPVFCTQSELKKITNFFKMRRMMWAPGICQLIDMFEMMSTVGEIKLELEKLKQEISELKGIPASKEKKVRTFGG